MSKIVVHKKSLFTFQSNGTGLYTHLFSLRTCGVPNENNRSYLKNNRYIGENNRAHFKELQNRIISKIKSILNSGLAICTSNHEVVWAACIAIPKGILTMIYSSLP